MFNYIIHAILFHATINNHSLKTDNYINNSINYINNSINSINSK